MIFAFLCVVLGVAAWFVPEPAQPPVLLACLASGVLYVRAMNRRARGDAR